jgi:hypothetical protein
VTVSPTAQHSSGGDGDAHVTAIKALEPLGLGESTIVHEVPSHRSISVCPKPFLSSLLPAAQHSDADMQATPAKTSIGGVLSPLFGELTIFHALPFQCSISVR